MRTHSSGFTLVQLLCVSAIAAILAALAYPSYQRYVRSADMRAAHAALLDNARFMERFYQQKGSFKKNSTTWPDLPITGTNTFCIRPNNTAKGALDSQFTLKAVAFDKAQEARVLKINESLNAVVCESSSSTCEEKNAFFRGTEDKGCTLFQP